jgi:hypothetical protein
MWFPWLPCQWGAVGLASFPTKSNNVPGGALVGGSSNGQVGVSRSFWRRWSGIRSTVSWSSMLAITLTEPPQRPQPSMSISSPSYKPSLTNKVAIKLIYYASAKTNDGISIAFSHHRLLMAINERGESGIGLNSPLSTVQCTSCPTS